MLNPKERKVTSSNKHMVPIETQQNSLFNIHVEVEKAHRDRDSEKEKLSFNYLKTNHSLDDIIEKQL